MSERNVPEVRFRGFSGEWENNLFGKCVLIQRGGSPRPIENFMTNSENGINWIKIGDVSIGSRYITKTAEKIIPEGEKYSRKVCRGDLILSNSMSFGRPYIMDIDGCIHDGWLLIRNEQKKFDIEYLQQMLSSTYMLIQYKSLASGGVVNNLNSELVQSTTVCYPQTDEQSKIGEFFKNLDNLIAQNQKKYDKLVNMKKACLDKMFPKDGADTPEVRFIGFSGEWEKKDFLQVAKYKNGKAHENSICEDGEFVVINSKFVSTNGEARKHTDIQMEPLYKNDLAFVLSDVPNGRAIAKTFIVDADNKYSLNQRIAGISALESIYPYFLHLLLNRNKYFLMFDDGVKQTNLSVQDIYDFVSFYPNKNEQAKIGTFFQNLDNLIALQKTKLEKLKNIKKACLDKMFI